MLEDGPPVVWLDDKKSKIRIKKYIVQWRVPNACGRGRLISGQSERIKRSISSMSTVIVAGSRVDS